MDRSRHHRPPPPGPCVCWKGHAPPDLRAENVGFAQWTAERTVDVVARRLRLCPPSAPRPAKGYNGTLAWICTRNRILNPARPCLDHRPSIGSKNDHRYPPAAKVLLESNVLVAGYEDLNSCPRCLIKQISVQQPPPSPSDRPYGRHVPVRCSQGLLAHSGQAGLGP